MGVPMTFNNDCIIPNSARIESPVLLMVNK